jgi:hypothetical protein
VGPPANVFSITFELIVKASKQAKESKKTRHRGTHQRPSIAAQHFTKHFLGLLFITGVKVVNADLCAVRSQLYLGDEIKSK